MANMILGRKGRMTQMFTEAGVCIPVTLVEAGPCWVTAKRTQDANGYDAIQIGFETVREKVVSKAEVGHCKKTSCPPLRHLRELRLDGPSDLEAGAELKCDIFGVGDMVDVIGDSKGRGFAGVMKRHGFAGGRMTHGGMARRRPGSISMSAYPGKVFKGKKMSGHFGAERNTSKNLEIMVVDVEKNILAIRGSVPGHRGSLLHIRTAKTARV